MTIKASGSLSIEEIVAEFGGTDPDALDEYYRGAGLVTENNTGVPTSGAMNMDVFYNTVLQLTKIVSSNVNNLVLSSLFTEAEWTSSAPKVVQINTGITIGSTDPSVVSCRSGTTVNGQPMAGTLRLINNGYIYGAGGIGSSSGIGGNGGNSFQAEIAMEIDNINGRIYAGGGGGGKAGQGANVWFYPENVTWKLDIFGGTSWLRNTTDWNQHGTVDHRIILNSVTQWEVLDSTVWDWPSPVHVGSYYYEKGASGGTIFYNDYWYLRRRLDYTIVGGAGGNGGNGIGSNQARTNGATGQAVTNGCSGGNGGNGGDWGQGATSGANGNSGDINYHIEQLAAGSGFSGGSSGNYIIGNSNVTWINNGLRLGGVA